mgnify:CR=1 FL=1
MSDMVDPDLTGLLLRCSEGDVDAREELLPVVYDELRRVAGGFMRRERQGHTLQPTALVHEAYLRLVDQSRVEWRNSVHFTALAATMMRRILIDHARSHQVAKRGGGAPRVSLDDAPALAAGTPPDILQVNEALTELTRHQSELGRIVELRYFGGLNNEEVAEAMGVSVPTVVRRWRLARAWLFRYLTGEAVDL